MAERARALQAWILGPLSRLGVRDLGEQYARLHLDPSRKAVEHVT